MAYYHGDVTAHDVIARNSAIIGEAGSPIKEFRMGQCRLKSGEAQVEAHGVTDQTKIFVVYNVIVGKAGLAFDISRIANEYVIIRSLKTSQGAIETEDFSVLDWIAFEPLRFVEEIQSERERD